MRLTSVLQARAGFRLCFMLNALDPPCLSTDVDLMTSHAKSYVLVAAVFLRLLTGCVSQSDCVWKATPPKPEDFVGVWIGFEQDELDFVRLDLRRDFTGYCARVSPADTSLHDYGVEAYRVTHWTLEDWKLVISLTP